MNEPHCYKCNDTGSGIQIMAHDVSDIPVSIAGVNDNFLGVAPDLGYAEKQ